jgi:hypothetical protein
MRERSLRCATMISITAVTFTAIISAPIIGRWNAPMAVVTQAARRIATRSADLAAMPAVMSLRAACGIAACSRIARRRIVRRLSNTAQRRELLTRVVRRVTVNALAALVPTLTAAKIAGRIALTRIAAARTAAEIVVARIVEEIVAARIAAGRIVEE